MVHIRKFSKSVGQALAIAVVALGFSLKVEAEVLFEGYYKVSLSGTHAGYVIQKYELDAAKKLFTGSYYIYVRLSPDGKKFINESLVAKANDKFQPLSYQYSGLIGDVNETSGQAETRVTTIDATFKGQKMTLKGVKDGKNLAANHTYPSGAFLSNFLIYLMLQKGFKVGRNFEFNAISEEEGLVHKGRARIVAEETFKGVPAFKVNWDFKNLASTSYISTTGNALATESPAQRVSQELVSTPSEATTGFPFPKQSIEKIFGNIPSGATNVFAQQKSSSVAPAPAASAPADTPPPAIVIKPQPPTKGP